jgi:hypothetical protein
VVVRDHEVALPRASALEVRADGLWAECTCETPLEHWTYGLEAFGVRLDDPADAYRGEIGERLPVGFDLEWELASAPVADSPARYAQGGTVVGELLLGRDRIALDGTGVRAHGWGAASPWNAGTTRLAVTHPDGRLVPAIDTGDLDALASAVVPITEPLPPAWVTRTLVATTGDGRVRGWAERVEQG